MRAPMATQGHPTNVTYKFVDACMRGTRVDGYIHLSCVSILIFLFFCSSEGQPCMPSAFALHSAMNLNTYVYVTVYMMCCF
jgi:hypothetical protein